MSKDRLEEHTHVGISMLEYQEYKDLKKRVQDLEEIKSDAIKQIDVTQRRNKRLEERVRELEENLEYGAKVAVETARRLHQSQEQKTAIVKRWKE